MGKQTVAVLFGGVSPEHEVSIISGLQILKNIDKEKYSTLAIFIDKRGLFWHIENYSQEKDFLKNKRTQVIFGKDENGGFLKANSFFGKKYYINCAYLTLHGGAGETGIIQGMLESVSTPYTSPNVESSVLCMNKQLSKVLVSNNNVPIVEGISILSSDIQMNIEESLNIVKNKIGLPAIIKPVHLGSSIGLSICKTDIELKKGLLTASQVDDEVLIEKFLNNFFEFNVSVFQKGSEIIFSAIEKPVKKDEILSFKDKYENGAKGKTGSGGMASLDRELPAKISDELKDTILTYSKIVYRTLKCKGQVRIDYIFAENKLYFSEINPIPGSLSFYLWEPTGELFKDQITRVIDESVSTSNNSNYFLEYSADIVEKYIEGISSKDL